MQSINLYSRIAYLAQYQGSKLAVETAKEQLTYRQLDDLARRIAGLLRSSGVGEGDIVGVRLQDGPGHVAAFLAIMRVGGIILPLDFRATRAEFERVVAQFRPKTILNDSSPVLDWPPEIVDLARASACEPDDVPPATAPGGVMALTMTSGTTGQPKAMVTTHEQTYARCVTRALEGMFVGDDRFLTTLPLAYLAGREHALNPLVLGATLVMFPTLFEPAALVDYVNSRNITAFNLSPNMSRALLGLATKEGGTGMLMPSVRMMISTTGKLDPPERAALRKHVVPRMIDYYGNSGVGPIAVIAREEDAPEPTAVGRVAIGVEVEIVDESGKALAAGEVGRVRLRGRAVTTEMAGAADPQEEGVRDGWYYPGDIGRIGERGILHLEGRSADLIKRGGLMVHAQEVEQVLRRYPGVKDAAVCGVASAELGQEVVAFVEATETLDPKEIIRSCRGELAGYKIPARIVFVDSLPRNPSGKVVKAELLKRM